MHDGFHHFHHSVLRLEQVAVQQDWEEGHCALGVTSMVDGTREQLPRVGFAEGAEAGVPLGFFQQRALELSAKARREVVTRGHITIVGGHKEASEMHGGVRDTKIENTPQTSRKRGVCRIVRKKSASPFSRRFPRPRGPMCMMQGRMSLG